MGGQDRTDEKIARLAWRAHGVVTRERLLGAEITARQIERRVERGALIVEYRGVYRVGHRAPSVEATYMAAVLACGEGALLMGAVAAHLYGLIKGEPPAPVWTKTERKIEGIETHRARTDRRGTTWRGIPVTTIPHEAQVRHHVRPNAFPQRVPRKLRAILYGHIRVTLSELERRVLETLQAEGLPPPITNRPAGTKRVDCRWPDHHLTVELDSYRYHHTRHAWEQDRIREREAHARGDDHRRYTYSDVFEDPHHVLEELHDLLA